jgi:hypothetical protein
MPSQTSVNIQINNAPAGGTIAVVPATGTALDTQFEIKLADFKDEDLPLNYQYMIYTCPGFYATELKDGVDPNTDCRHILMHPMALNSYKTQLPTGTLNEDTGNSEIEVVVKVIDGLGGYRNVTQIVTVDAPTETQAYETIKKMLYETPNATNETEKMESLILVTVELKRLYELNKDNLRRVL